MKTVFMNTTKTARATFFDTGAFALRSYYTEVITVNADGWLVCNGTYSNTTRRHIGNFMKQYTPNGTYQIAKKSFEENLKYNIYTGEFLPR